MELLKEPKTKRGKETLKKIFQSAETLFAEKGYYDTQIHDITSGAGIGAGTFYTYFPDKLSCFKYILKVLSSDLRHQLSESIKDSKSFIEAEEIGLECFLAFTAKHQGLFKIVWQAQFVDMESFKEYYQTFSKGYSKHIEKAKNIGAIKGLDTELLTYHLMGIYNFIALKYIIFEETYPSKEIIKETMVLLKEGLLA